MDEISLYSDFTKRLLLASSEGKSMLVGFTIVEIHTEKT